MDIIGYPCKVSDTELSSYSEVWVNDELTNHGFNVVVPLLFKFIFIEQLQNTVIERVFFSMQNPFCKKEIQIFPIEGVYKSSINMDTTRILYIGHIINLLKILNPNKDCLYGSFNEIIYDTINTIGNDDRPNIIDLEKNYRSDTLNKVSYPVDGLYNELCSMLINNNIDFGIREIADVLETVGVRLPIRDKIGSTLAVLNKVTNKSKCLSNLFSSNDIGTFKINMNPRTLFDENIVVIENMTIDKRDVDIYAIAQYIHNHKYSDIHVVISGDIVDIITMYDCISDTHYTDIRREAEHSTDNIRDELWCTIKNNILSYPMILKITIHKNSHSEQSHIYEFINEPHERKYLIDGHLLQLVSRSISCL